MHRLQRLIQKTTERSISMEHYTSPEMEIIVFEAEDVIAARDELAAFLHDVLGLETEKGFVDRVSRSVKIG